MAHEQPGESTAVITSHRVKLRDLSAQARAAAMAAAAAALRDGRLIVLPTDTVYGVAASAASAESVARLRALTRRNAAAGGAPSAWHAPSAEAVLNALDPPHPAHRRMLTRLLPGPVTFVVELDPGRLDAIRAALGAAPNSLDNGRELAVRVPDHAIARDVLTRCGAPVIAESIAAAGWPKADSLNSPAPPAAEGIEALLDDGPTRYGMPTTRVRLAADGSYAVLSTGAIEKQDIHRALERTLLFVCSGNTCRSPMAAAIARDLISRGAAPQSPGVRLVVHSAGTGAAAGDGITREAAEALRRVGIDADEHRSAPLTRAMVAGADAIFAMTPGHLRSILSLDPSAADRAHTLDPSGEAIDDPIGEGQEVYDRTAARLRELIEARLRELEP